MGRELFVAALDRVRGVTSSGTEYWRARDIQPILGYARWERFAEVIHRAMMACESTGITPTNHFLVTGNMVDIGSGAQRERADWVLSRYACYLVAMNGDTSKTEIGYAQTYFAIQTRRQEIQDQLTGDERRLLLRNRVKEANRSLASTAKKAGVQRYAIFQDEGYRGLYGGHGQAEVKQLKAIPDKAALLDCIGRVELAANEFRITQTEQKLVRDRISGEPEANRTHHGVGREVRETIRKIGGTMPEDLPAEQPIQKLIARRKKQLRAANKTLP